jgi:hypothetical protein
MPLYKFRVPLTLDPVAVEFANDDEAWDEAVILSGELLGEMSGKRPPVLEWDVWVTEGERTVATVRVTAQRYPARDAADAALNAETQGPRYSSKETANENRRATSLD